MLPAATSLRSLRLDDNQLCGLDEDGDGTYTAEGINKLCEALKGSAVTSLNLAENALCGVSVYSSRGEGTYTTEGITKLCEWLKGSAVTSLNLGWNTIGAEGASALAAILKETQITTLGLEANFIGVEGASALAAVLKETMISNLKVDQHTLQIDDLTGTKPTEKIDLCWKPLGVASAIIIASCIKGNGVLKELNLASSEICGLDACGGGIYTAEGITKLCEGLKGSAVTSLVLYGNCIGDEGASALSAILKETQITNLEISDNDIGDNGASALAAVLKETQVVNLDVGFNNITGDAADHLAKVVLEHALMTDFCGIPLVSLRENSITELNLGKKGVGMPGAIVLSKLLPSAVALTSLNLERNLLCAEGGAALAAGLKGNSTLQVLRLCGNAIGMYLDDEQRMFVATTEGINALCEGLKGSSVTSLECGRRHPEVFTFLSAPADKLIHTLLLVHSIEDNYLTEEAKQTLQDAAGSSVHIKF